MRKRKKSESISTFLGSDSYIEGVLEFQGIIRLDGKVKGKIHSTQGTVIVGEKAVIDADMLVDGAIIMGEVNGTIDAREKIEVYPPGRVNGDINAPSITIDSGATFNGNCGMKAREMDLNRFIESPRDLPAPDEAGGN
jgi:cytoskeletal protein CcmA (bactofilin family)